MEKSYIGEPVEQLHGLIIEVYHEYTKAVKEFCKENLDEIDINICIGPRILNSIIVTAKKRIKPHNGNLT